jgi:phage terminase small subunit
MSVGFAEKASEATCKTCLAFAADGTLERLERSQIETKQTGSNQSGNPRYTPKQRAFASHPNVTTDAKKAALAAGYSESYAHSHAVSLRKQLAPLIMEYQEKAIARSAISVARVQSELAAMGFSNVLDYYHIEENGEMIPKQLNELTREEAAAIQEVKLMKIEDPVTGEVRVVIESLKLADKRANLVELGKTIGMFNKIQIEDKRGDTLLLAEVPTDALEDAEKLLLNAVTKAREQKSKNDAIPGEYKELPQPGAVESETP